MVGWGTEGVGTDAGQAHAFTQPFPCHSVMHGNNRYGLASLVNLDQLPPTGAILITPPLKIRRGSGVRAGCWRWSRRSAPVRVFPGSRASENTLARFDFAGQT